MLQRLNWIKQIWMEHQGCQLLISFIIGTMLAFLICPYLLLNPTDVNYLRLDEGQNFFGWAFYRADDWHWPITVTYNLMYPLGVSITYTDSYPFLAIILKVISKYLPPIFIFHGIVLVINFSLMFFAANTLLRKMTHDWTYSFWASFFFVFATPFIFRFSASHAALSSHWILILCFLPVVAENDKAERTLIMFWGLLLLSFGVHAYLSSMVMILLLTYIWQLWWQKKLPVLRIVRISCAGLAMMPVVLYFLGYFFNYGTGQSSGFGYFCANLQAFINPMLNTSLFFPSLEQPDGQLGGYAYMGLGVFMMFPVAFYYFWRYKAFDKKLIPLYVSMILCWLFSLSNNIYWGKKLLFHFDADFALLHIFRASNRYLWLPFYAILLYLLVALFRMVNRPRLRLVFLLFLLTLQLVDTFPLITKLHDAFVPKPYAYGHELDKKFWLNLGEKYQHMYIDMLYTDQFNTDYYGNAHMYKLAYYAVINNLTLNNFYLARTTETNTRYNRKTYEDFLAGKMDRDTLYVMDDKTMSRLTPALRSTACRKEGGYNVCSLIIGDELSTKNK